MTASLFRQALIEDALAEHVLFEGREWTCGADDCDWSLPFTSFSKQPSDEHRTHLAAVLAALDAPQGGDEATRVRIADEIEAYAQSEEARLGRDQAGLVGNWIGGIREGVAIALGTHVRPTPAAETEDPFIIPAAAKLQPGDCVRYLGRGSWELLDGEADRLAAPRDQGGLAEKVRALADEWQTNANALLKQGVIERSVRSTMVGCALALRALLDQPDATASEGSE